MVVAPVHCLAVVAIASKPVPALVKSPVPVMTAPFPAKVVSSNKRALNPAVSIVPPPAPSLIVLSPVNLLNNTG